MDYPVKVHVQGTDPHTQQATAPLAAEWTGPRWARGCNRECARRCPRDRTVRSSRRNSPPRSAPSGELHSYSRRRGQRSIAQSLYRAAMVAGAAEALQRQPASYTRRMRQVVAAASRALLGWSTRDRRHTAAQTLGARADSTAQALRDQDRPCCHDSPCQSHTGIAACR